MKIAEVVKQDISILDYARHKGFTIKRVGYEEYTLEEHDSVRIDAVRNLFYRHATGQGGSIIDFTMMVENVDKYEALSILRDYLHQEKPYLLSQIDLVKKSRVPPTVIPPKKFVLPEAVEGRNNRVFAYLSKTRGIDPLIINEFIHNNQLYEDTSHNCIFVGYDNDNNAAYAMRRGTLTDKPFKGEISGSKKEVGLFVNNNATSLFVNESVIDSLSIMTILKMNGRDYKRYDYLALGGVSSGALVYHLPNSGIKKIFLALDNDEAGRKGKNHIMEVLKKSGYDGAVIDKTPVNKDFNQDLQNIIGVDTGNEIAHTKQGDSTKKQAIER